MYGGWRVSLSLSLVCGIKWKCLAAGGIGETPRIRLFRGGSARTKANKGVIRICPFVLSSALKAMFPTLMPKKPRFISPGDHASEQYIGADKIQRWLMKSSPFSVTRRFHRFVRGRRYARCNTYPSTIILLPENSDESISSKMCHVVTKYFIHLRIT